MATMACQATAASLCIRGGQGAGTGGKCNYSTMQFSWVRRARKLQSITSATLKLPGMPRYLRLRLHLPLPLLLPLLFLLLLVLRHLQWGNFKKAAKLGHFKSLEAEVPTKAIGQKGCQNHKAQGGNKRS